MLVSPVDMETYEVFFDSFKKMGGGKFLNQVTQVMECEKMN